MRMNPECYYSQEELKFWKHWANGLIAHAEKIGKGDHPAVADERHNLRVIAELEAQHEQAR